MKTRCKKTFTLFLLGLLCLMVIPPSAWAQDTPTTAPLNPAFVQYLTDRETGTLNATTADGYGLGYIPEPLARAATVATDNIDTTSFPASYDLRATGRLTAVRAQGNLGVCWTFASLGSLESTLRPDITADLSENNMRWNHGFDSGPESGGNADMALAYMARWNGPVNESSDPYYTGQKIGLAPVYHVQQAEFLPVSAAALKQALIDGGAVFTSLYASAVDNPSYFNSKTSALYYNGSAGTDHAVLVVGWDDNYDRSNFATPPPGNGAWIIKNSWGSDWGDGGYFYLSYYDTYATHTLTTFNNAEATTNYNRIYQYDPLGKCSAHGYNTPDGSAWGANIFTAAASENLTAISTYAMGANTTAEIRIYTGVSAGNPSSGQLRTTQTANFANEGYYTVDLNTPVGLTANQNFAVVVKYTSPQTSYPIPIERPIANYSSQASANAGESFINADLNGSWYDIGANSKSNVCIKAFTGGQSAVTLTGIAITNPATKLVYQIGESLDLTGLVVTGTYSDGTTRIETVTAANISGFDSSTAGTRTLTITIDGQTASYTVQINSGDVPVDPTVNVYYRTHVQNIGWQGTKQNGEVSGTSGLSLRLEAIQIKVDAPANDLGIAYCTHVQNIGWQDWRYNGDLSGTSGYGLRLEAIEIQLVGNDANLFDVYYRVHAQNFGWMGWGVNGEMAGTSGYGYRLEAIQIEVVPKGTYYSVDSADGPAYVTADPGAIAQ